MKSLFLFLSLTTAGICYAQQSTYDQFQEIFYKGDRAATVDDMKQVEKCFVSSKQSASSVFLTSFKYEQKEVDLGPVLGKRTIDKFMVKFLVNSFDLNELGFTINEENNALVFISKDKDQTQEANFKFGYNGQDIILIRLLNKVRAGQDEFGNQFYFREYFVGQCTLKTN